MPEITPIIERDEYYKMLFDERAVTQIISDTDDEESRVEEYSRTPVDEKADVAEQYERRVGDWRTLTRNDVMQLEERAVRFQRKWGDFNKESSKSVLSDQTAQEEEVSSDRLKLLARKYARKDFSKEDEARLVMVTERLRHLVPRVTVDDFAVLEKMATRIREMEKEDDEVREWLEARRSKK